MRQYENRELERVYCLEEVSLELEFEQRQGADIYVCPEFQGLGSW